LYWEIADGSALAFTQVATASSVARRDYYISPIGPTKKEKRGENVLSAHLAVCLQRYRSLMAFKAILQTLWRGKGGQCQKLVMQPHSEAKFFWVK